MDTNALMRSVLQRQRRKWGGKDGKEGGECGKQGENDKKAIARELLSAAAIFHYTALRQRRQSSIFSRPHLPPPKSNYYSPVFLRCFAMGKMKPSTYQLSAYTSDWGVRTGTMKLLFTFYLRGGCWRSDHRRLPFEIPLARRHQHI